MIKFAAALGALCALAVTSSALAANPPVAINVDAAANRHTIDEP
jgi:hypothetical protein